MKAEELIHLMHPTFSPHGQKSSVRGVVEEWEGSNKLGHQRSVDESGDLPKLA